MKRLLLWAPLILFGLGGLALLFIFLRAGSEGAFQSNLLPELIGFCLEGFFLVGLFSLIQLRLARERKNELRKSLRAALREILSNLDVALLEKNENPASNKSLDHDPYFVKAIMVKLLNSQLDLDAMLNIKVAAARNVSTTHDLIPVAANLSADHMQWWLAIVKSVRLLSEAKDKSSIHFAAHKFLANLSDFDELSL